MAADTAEERQLTMDVASAVLRREAPEELELFDEIAAEYFRDEVRLLRGGGRDETLGFGVDLALVAPYVLAVVSSVLTHLESMVADSVQEATRPVLVRMVRRLFRISDGEDDSATPAMSRKQADIVRKVARDRGEELGISQSQADSLADAIVAELVFPRTD
jgi:hypothetical protein